jgi:hypothetical protein
MTRHQRAAVYDFAHNELDKFVIDLCDKYKLTYGELFGILGQVMCSWARWQVKDEREEDKHGKTVS